MAPPPPSQKGKFKPRRPQKKIKTPATTAATATASTDTATSSSGSTTRRQEVTFAPTTAPVPRTNTTRSGKKGTTRGGRGRGRGGRGRGRGAPIPSGRVFFTATEKSKTGKPSAPSTRPTPASLSSSNVSSKQSQAKHEKRKSARESSTEEVVGELDSGIGERTARKETVSSQYTKREETLDYEHEDMNVVPSGRKSGDSHVLVYSSDSSDEEGMNGRGGNAGRQDIMLPLELPFRPSFNTMDVDTVDDGQESYYSTEKYVDASSIHVPNNAGDGGMPVRAPPFVAADDPEQLKQERDSWFLVQLPTRLPPIKQKAAEASESDPVEEEDDPVAVSAGSIFGTSEVVSPPLKTGTHDQVLTNAAAGRIGKIQMYKSGKAVLVLDGPPGTEQIRMNVNEGLSCGFLQQAVVLDVASHNLISLGEVKKSIVVSPDMTDICSVP